MLPRGRQLQSLESVIFKIILKQMKIMHLLTTLKNNLTRLPKTIHLSLHLQQNCSPLLRTHSREYRFLWARMNM